PVNWKTGKRYRGINLMLLDGGEYATFKQIKDAGGKVIKGSEAHTVVFWKMINVKDEDSEDENYQKKFQCYVLIMFLKLIHKFKGWKVKENHLKMIMNQ